MKTIRLGTRKSRLARIQTGMIREALEQKDPAKARCAMEDHVNQYAAQIKEQFL